MNIEKIADILIYYIHVPFGGIALLAGGIALIAKKGNRLHKNAGKIFFYAMLTSAIAAFIISNLPNHKSPFLFSIGLFSSYFIISGLRSLKYKRKEFNLRIDKSIAYAIIIIGIVMIMYPILSNGQLNIILAVFGVVGVGFGIRDLRIYRDLPRLKEKWLALHLGKMTGGYIAAVSTFFVVNQILPGIWNWFVPGIVGSAFITARIIKLNK